MFLSTQPFSVACSAAGQRLVGDVGDLDQLLHVGRIDQPALHRGLAAFAVERHEVDVLVQVGADQILVAQRLAQQGHEVDAGADLADQVGGGDGAAAEDLPALVLGGDDVFLGGLAQRLDVDVLVEDGVADHQAALLLDRRHFLLHVVDRDARAQVLEIGRGLLRIERHHPVGEVGRAEGDVLGVQNLAAELLDGQPLGLDAAGDVGFLVGIFRALQVVARLDGLEHVLGAWIGRNADIVDAFQSGDHLGAQLLGEDRAIGTLVDEPVGGQRDDQQVTVTLADIEMALVPDMEDVEHAVRQHHLAALGALRSGDLAQFAERLDLVQHRYAVPCQLSYRKRTPYWPIGGRDR